LVEVDTTAAGASSTAGMTMQLVLPERGGPTTSMEDSPEAQQKPLARSPA
jgi:hypothetical protein